MQHAQLLAQFWGLVLVILGAIFLIKRENISLLIKMVADDSMILLTGYLSVIIGVAHILTYNEWVADWTIIITLIGWLALLKGVIRLSFPSVTQRIIKSHDNPVSISIGLAAMILVGGFLIIKGFELV